MSPFLDTIRKVLTVPSGQITASWEGLTLLCGQPNPPQHHKQVCIAAALTAYTCLGSQKWRLQWENDL